MAITFENEKILFDDKYRTAKEIDCFLPVHLTIGGKENDLYKKVDDSKGFCEVRANIFKGKRVNR